MKSITQKLVLGAGILVGSWGIAQVSQIGVEERSRALPTHGDVSGALKQAEQLMAQLRSNGFDERKIDRRLLRLPDQSYSESKRFRGPGETSFILPRHPIYSKVAFYTFLYVRINLEVQKSIEGTTRPEGFVIVGWRDGRVTQVPIAEVRLLANPEEPGSASFVWPGMDQYSPSLPRFIQISAPKG